jgi:hypothetical protein
LLRASEVSAVIVTRGDVDLSPVLDSLPFEDVVVWDNARRERNLGVYGRYAAIAEAKNDVIYAQDDDCVLEDFDALLAEYVSGSITANMPADHAAGGTDYSDSALIGWGSLFARHLPFAAFERYAVKYPIDDDVFHRTCDVVFSVLTPHKRCDIGFEHLPHAYADNKMYRQSGNYQERLEVLRRARRVRDGSRLATARRAAAARWARLLAND